MKNHPIDNLMVMFIVRFLFILSVMPIIGCVYTPEIAPLTFNSSEERIQAVKSYPMEITVPYSEAIYSWDRTLYYFTTYLGAKVVSPNKDRLARAITLAVSSPNFSYTVEREPLAQGIKYRVKCLSKNPNQQNDKNAEINARNLSRFIADKKLELSLLSK